jgi:ammonia channel protein AmtB
MQPTEMAGHNASLAILGVFILWFGWCALAQRSVSACSVQL